MISFSGRAHTLVCVFKKFFGQNFPFGIFFLPFLRIKKTMKLLKYVYDCCIICVLTILFVGSKK